MKLLVNDKVIKNVLERIGVNYSVNGTPFEIDGYRMTIENDGHFYLQEVEEEINTFCIVETENEACFTLDKFQHPFVYTKIKAEIKQKTLILQSENTHGEETVFVYKKTRNYVLPDINEFIELTDEHINNLSHCDIFLTIPGKYNSDVDLSALKDNGTSELFGYYKANINDVTKHEIAGWANSEFNRIYAGDVTLNIKTDNKGYTQFAQVYIVYHITGVCVVEFYIPNCYIGGNKIINYFCEDLIEYSFNSEKPCSSRELLEKLSIRPFGTKRSMVFAYGNVNEQEIVRALMNEENPYTRFKDDYIKEILSDNIAVYNSADVYVSPTTIIEICKDNTANQSPSERLEYQIMELFFVELLLIQDASIDKVYRQLQCEKERVIKGSEGIDDSIEYLDQLSYDLSECIKFSDYSMYRYPVTKASAEKITKKLEIDKIYKKYEENRTVIETLISINERKRFSQADRVEQRFLLIITIISALDAVLEILTPLNIIWLRYVISFASIGIILALYFYFKFKIKNKRGKNTNEQK